MPLHEDRRLVISLIFSWLIKSLLQAKRVHSGILGRLQQVLGQQNGQQAKLQLRNRRQVLVNGPLLQNQQQLLGVTGSQERHQKPRQRQVAGMQ